MEGHWRLMAAALVAAMGFAAVAAGCGGGGSIGGGTTAAVSASDPTATVAAAPTLDEVRAKIAGAGAAWSAGTTPVASLPVPEFKALLGLSAPAAAPGSPAASPEGAAALPASFDWRSATSAVFLSPVRDQRSARPGAVTGTCVAFAVCAAAESAFRLAGRGGPDLDLSEWHLHARARGAAGGWDLASALERLASEGTVSEAACPYTLNPDLPGAAADVAPRFRIGGFAAVRGAAAAKRAILEAGPVGAAMEVFSDFRYYTGGVYEPVVASSEGFHAVLLVGWDDAAGCWIGRNSWGPGWGEAGYFNIKYDRCGLGVWPFWRVHAPAPDPPAGGDPPADTVPVVIVDPPADTTPVVVVDPPADTVPVVIVDPPVDTTPVVVVDPPVVAVPPLAPPLFSPAPGVYPGRVDVTLAAEDGARIRYTRDGGDPAGPGATDYVHPLVLTGPAMLRAVAVAGGRVSPVAEGFFDVRPVGAPPQRALDLGGGVTLDLVWIDPGTFLMGSPGSDPELYLDETPVRPVTITRGYWLGRTEVTQRQWTAIMGDERGEILHGAGDDYPVYNVTWYECGTFCARLAARAGEPCRLPTEAEWEFACRGGTATRFFWGDTADARYAWYRPPSTAEVGVLHRVGTTILPHPLGLADISGNVWEWVDDWYDRAYYATGPAVDPAGPASGTLKVFRGGSYDYIARSARAAKRNAYLPAGKSPSLGFRVVVGESVIPPALSVELPAAPLEVVQNGTYTVRVVVTGDPAGSFNLELGLADTPSSAIFASTFFNGAVAAGAHTFAAPTAGLTPGVCYVIARVTDTAHPTVPPFRVTGTVPVTISPPPADPALADPPRGTYGGAIEVAVASATPGALIRYTLDGGDPATNGIPLVGGKVSIAATSQLRTVCWSADRSTSAVGVYNYTVLPGVRTVTLAGLPQTFRWIPAGTFTMGSPAGEPGRSADEGPERAVTLTRGFWFGETEVTRSLYAAAAGHSAPGSGAGDEPAAGLAWVAASTLAVTLDAALAVDGVLRLPTEAEWEFACRGGASTAYPWGAAFDAAYAWDTTEAGGVAQPVGAKLPNAFALRDVCGNAAEWCADWYGAYPAAPETDPAGPPAGAARVLRGGSFLDPPDRLRAAARASADPALPVPGAGLRLVLEPYRP